MTDVFAPATQPSHRLIPSRFPPIGPFDTVATAADLEAVMDLVGWTNDRVVADRVARLPQAERVDNSPNSCIVMAAFLHVVPGGMRFNGPELGAWYAADDVRTCAAEVGHHLRREAVARGVPAMTRVFLAYASTVLGDYLGIRGHQTARADVYDSSRYDAAQQLGEAVRASGGAGIVYSSLRRRGAANVVAHRPRNVVDVLQTDLFEITVSATARTIEVQKLASTV